MMGPGECRGRWVWWQWCYCGRVGMVREGLLIAWGIAERVFPV